jgi:hypothetical protein
MKSLETKGVARIVSWPHGNCEAGACSKRARWLVDGVLLCGEHKKEKGVSKS